MDQKKLDIIRQVAQLYGTYGIKSITMDEVSRQLGISKKTLYEHFTDKTDLVKSVIHQITTEREEQFCKTQKQAQNALEELLSIYGFYLKMLKEVNPSFEFDLKKYYPEIYTELINTRRQRMKEASLQNLRKGKEEGLFRKEIDEDIIVRLQLLRVESISSTDLFTHEELYSKHFVEEMFFYHLYGILSEKGVAYLKAHLNLIKK